MQGIPLLLPLTDVLRLVPVPCACRQCGVHYLPRVIIETSNLLHLTRVARTDQEDRAHSKDAEGPRIRSRGKLSGETCQSQRRRWCSALDRPRPPLHFSIHGVQFQSRRNKRWRSSSLTKKSLLVVCGLTPRGMWTLISLVLLHSHVSNRS